MSSPTSRSKSPLPSPSFSPPKTILPRSQPPRPTVAHSTPVLPTKTSVPMSHTASMPAFSQPPSTSSTGSSSSSFRPAITPSTSNVFTAAQTRSPPQYGKVRSLTTSSASSSGTNTTTGTGGLHPGTSSGTNLPAVVPQTGASKMAAAAKRGATGLDGIPRPRRGSQAVPVEEEDHPLSEKSLQARDYMTLHTLSHLFHLPSRWKLIRPLGQGAYGLVISVQDTLSGEPVAVKCITRVFDKVILARRALREITLLRHFGEHDNLTGLIDLDNVWYGYNEIYLYMEPMEADLHQIVRSGQALSNTHIQFFLYQLLRGMKYIHSANVIHRDLKPGNLLVNSDCELKICDFGLARGFKPVVGEADQNDPKLTEYVATRWYRAPEIMMSNRRYTTAIDVWSIGCILGELLGGGPMFKGKDYVEQLNLILEMVGTPDEETLASMGSEKACAYMRTLPNHQPKELATVLPDADPLALDLVQQLLSFSPDSRIDVVQALSHPYVAYHHDEADEPSCPKVFDKWEQVESLETIEELREAITREIEEFRAEVRNVDTWSSSDEEVDDEQEILEEEEEEEEGEGDTTITSNPFENSNMPTVPGPSTSTSPIIQQRELGMGQSPKTSTHMLPSMSRTKSRGRGSLPPSPAMDEPNFSYNNGTAISRTSSRRTSGHSMSGRRPASFLFSPFGNGMTPLPSMISSQSQGPSITNASNANAPPNHPPHGQGHGHSASVDYYTYNGRRSRAPSTTGTGDYSLRPLIRQLSTVGMGVGGDDGVPVAGAESSKAGLGLEGLPVLNSHPQSNRRPSAGDNGLPPMGVTPSDAPPSTAPKSFGSDQKPSGPPSPK